MKSLSESRRNWLTDLVGSNVYFLILILLLLAGCGLPLPESPKGELCILSIERDSLICSKLNQEEIDVYVDGAKVKMAWVNMARRELAGDVRIIPLSEGDRYVSFSPDTWESISNYVDAMRNIITNRCN